MCPRVCRERVRPQQKPVRRMPGATGSPAHLRIHSLWEASGYIAGIISSKCQQEISTNLKPGRIPERCNGRGGRPISPVATLANRDGDGHRPPLRRTSGGSARLPPRTRRHPAGENERQKGPRWPRSRRKSGERIFQTSATTRSRICTQRCAPKTGRQIHNKVHENRK